MAGGASINRVVTIVIDIAGLVGRPGSPYPVGLEHPDSAQELPWFWLINSILRLLLRLVLFPPNIR